MRIGLVSEEFPPYVSGGIAVVCRDLAFALAKKGVETTVLCGSLGPGSAEFPIKNLRIVRLPVLELPPRFLWFQTRNCTRLLRFLGEVDVFHAVNPLSAAIPMFLGRRVDVPRVVSIHGSYRGNLITALAGPFRDLSMRDVSKQLIGYPIRESLSKLFRDSSDHFVVCSESTLREFSGQYHEVDPRKCSVIYNGVDLELLGRLEAPIPSARRNTHSLVFYGRLVPQKGASTLIKAFDIVRGNVPDVALDIFGEGPMEPSIRRIVSRLGLEKAVRLHGMVPRDDLMARMKDYDAVVLPSIYEGQPVAALEAMAMRRSLVMFDTPFSREFIENMKNGILARTGDVRDLAQKIEMVLTDKKFAEGIGERARKYVELNHNWDSLVEKYIAVYESLM